MQFLELGSSKRANKLQKHAFSTKFAKFPELFTKLISVRVYTAIQHLRVDSDRLELKTTTQFTGKNDTDRHVLVPLTEARM